MTLVDTTQRIYKKANDIKRRLLLPDSVRCFLLKRAGETSQFTPVKELISGYFVEWSGFREQMQFTLADDTYSYNNDVAQTSHIGYGVPNAGKIDVYVISNDTRDRVQPDVNSPFWKLYGTRVPSLRYTI